MTKSQVKKVEKLDSEIEDLQLSEMSSSEIERTVAAFSPEGVQLRAARKKIRYQLYRLRTEAEGKASATSTKEFIKAFESQPLFDGWRFFATTWDVAFENPMRIVHKDKSEQEEWDEVVAAKFPRITPGGGIEYPDIKVRKAVEAEAAKRKK